MKSVILICDKNFTLEDFRYLLEQDRYSSTNLHCLSETRLVIDYKSDGHVFFEEANILDEYEDDERSNLPYSTPNFILATYTSKGLLDKILQNINMPRGIFIEDNATIQEFDKYVEQVK